jgi:anti-sigma factor RsiW
MRPSVVISTEELHAYVDGALPAVRCFQVAAYLADHPGEAAHSEALRAQIAAMKALFDPVLDEPVPRRLSRVLPHAPPRRRRRLILLVATTIAAMIGIAVVVARTQSSAVSGTAIQIPATTSRAEPPTARRLPVLPPPSRAPQRPRGTDL